MTSVLMMSVSGIRGIVGETFSPELINKAASAFAKFSNYGTIVVGRDTRPTGEALSMNFISSLLLSGCNVVDIGVVPTPTVQLMVEELNATGGIVISASHNPVEWNALKLINSKGIFLNSSEVSRFFALMDKECKFKKWNQIGTYTKDNSASIMHIKKVLAAVDVKKIRKKKFKVVLDSVNGAGSEITPILLEKLGCIVTKINCTPDGMFPRVAEPLPEHLTQLSETVKKTSADIGFAQDPDADRLAIVDETGKPIGEEYTVTLVGDHLLLKEKGRVVVNLSTTKAIEDIAFKHGVNFTRTKVGEINVVDNMRKYGARIGGEGNGGIISPEIHLGRDSLAGIVYVLEMMAERKKTVSQIVKSMPAYFMKKGKIKLKNFTSSEIITTVKEQFKDQKISELDGLRVDFKKGSEFENSWIHLRASNTEPVFRIIAESDLQEKTDKIYRLISKMIK